MIAVGGLAAALAALLIPRPPAPEAPTAALFPTMAAALADVLQDPPAVLGVGELHQTDATAAIPSALARFTREILPILTVDGRTSDLIVETWVTDGACGQAEASTVAGVAAVTERPAATENEIVTLLRRAKEAGARPHVLNVSCADYRLLSPAARSGASGGSGGGSARDGGERFAAVDFERLLRLIERRLEAKVVEVLAAGRADPAPAGGVGGVGRMVVVYGGALHNDLHPDPALASFSYALPIFRATGGRTRELDLYVPEYLERNPAMRREPWYAVWRRAERSSPISGPIVIIRRSPASFILVFPRAGQSQR